MARFVGGETRKSEGMQVAVCSEYLRSEDFRSAVVSVARDRRLSDEVNAFRRFAESGIFFAATRGLKVVSCKP